MKAKGPIALLDKRLDELQELFESWGEPAYRASQGHRVAVICSMQAADDIRAAIRRHAESGQLRHVLLVGDAEPAAP